MVGTLAAPLAPIPADAASADITAGATAAAGIPGSLCPPASASTSRVLAAAGPVATPVGQPGNARCPASFR